MSVQTTMSPMTNSWSAHHKCTARWVSGASGAPAPGPVEPVGSSGGRRPAHGRSSSTHHPLAIPALRSQKSKSAWSRGGNVQEDGGRPSEESGEIATTAKIRRTKRGDGRGREKGSGRGTQVNVKTLITGTKRSTGIAEATTQTQSPLKVALYSSALDTQSLEPPCPPPVIILFFLLQNLPILTHCSPPSTPLCRGVAATCMI